MNCLYSDISESCSSIFTHEHLLQENIGGTLKSPRILCGTCNEYLGNAIDDELSKFYLKIISAISPFLPSALKKKSYLLPQDDGVILELMPGNQINFSRAKVFDEEQGVFSSRFYSPEKITQILKARYGEDGTIHREEMPFSKRYPSIKLPKTDYINPFRPAVKSCLNFIAYFDSNNFFPARVSFDSLRDTKKFVYTGRMNQEFSYVTRVPFIDFREEFSRWDTKHCLNHKFILSHDAREKETFVFLQLFNSFSWYFSVKDLFPDATRAFTFFYKKEFLPRISEKRDLLDLALITRKDIEQAKFLCHTQCSRRFSVSQFSKSLDDILKLAMFTCDLKYSRVVRETIRVELLCFKKQKDKAFLVLKKLVQDRFSNGRNDREIVQYLEQENQNETLTDARKIITYYKKRLPEIMDKFGPKYYFEK